MLYLLVDFEIQKYYQNKPQFEYVYSINNLQKLLVEQHILDGYTNIGTHWIACYAKNNDITYFNSFGVEQRRFSIPEEIK